MANQQVCKYFLQGRCSFGNQCRFFHPQPQNNNNTFNPQQQRNEDSLEIVVRDMREWHQRLPNGKSQSMWPFSCYSAERGQRVLFGFPDLSPDELRHIAYQARSGSLDTNAFLEATQRVAQCYDAVKNKLIHVAQDDSLRSSVAAVLRGNNTFSFNSSATLNLFESERPALQWLMDSARVAANMSCSVASKMLSSSTNLAQPNPQNSTAAPNASNTAGFSFANVSNQSVIMNQTNQPMGGQTSTISSPPTNVQVLFGSQQPNTNTSGSSLFGNANFGSAQSSTPLFASGQSASSTAPTNAAGTGNSLFQTSGQQNMTSNFSSHTQPAPGNSGPVKKSIYSAESELSADELRIYNAAEFELGRIPLRPPPKSVTNR